MRLEMVIGIKVGIMNVKNSFFSPQMILSKRYLFIMLTLISLPIIISSLIFFGTG